MGKYFAAAKLNFKSSYVYRFNSIVQIFIWNLSLLVAIIFWNAAFKEKTIIAGYNKSTMLTYVVMVNVVTMFSLRNVSNEVGRAINTGEINRYLVLPQNTLIYFYFKTLGRKLMNFTISVLLLVIFIPYMTIFTHVSFKLENIFAFIIALLIGTLISYFIGMIVGFAAFFLKEVSALDMFVQVIVSFLSGYYMPLSFFPKSIEKFVAILPFPSFGQFPVNIIIGNITRGKTITLMIIYVIWIFVLALISMLLWRVGIKKYEGAGA